MSELLFSSWEFWFGLSSGMLVGTWFGMLLWRSLLASSQKQLLDCLIFWIALLLTLKIKNDHARI
jgi:hypothetical protein